MNAPRFLPTWMKSFLNWKAEGRSDKICCRAVGISLNDLQRNLQNDPAFRADYDRVENSPVRKPVSY